MNNERIPMTINVRLTPDEAKTINDNFIHLSRTLGYRLNKSKLLKHILMNCNSKHSLYSLGFISYQTLHDQPKFKRGGKEIALKPRRMKRKD